MKISDEVYVHGYVDEIRNGTIIIRNEGGYFGTAPDEVMPSAQPNSKDLVGKIKNGITASDGNSEYFIGLRNGMRWCLSLIDDKEPIYESSAQPSDEYERGWKEGREALREETWEYVRDRFD